MVKDGNNVNYVKMEIMLMQMNCKTPHRWLKYTTRESRVCLCVCVCVDELVLTACLTALKLKVHLTKKLDKFP